MEASVRAGALAHSDECAACAERLEDESALSFKLRTLATETRKAPLPPLGNELPAALRSNRVAMRRTPVNSRWRYWSEAGAAVAAVVLVVITVAAIRSLVARLAFDPFVLRSGPRSDEIAGLARAAGFVPGPAQPDPLQPFFSMRLG